MICFLLSATTSNGSGSTIRDSIPMTWICHKLSIQAKATTATKPASICYPLYMIAVDDSVPFGQMLTVLVHEPYRSIIIYKIGAAIEIITKSERNKEDIPARVIE